MERGWRTMERRSFSRPLPLLGVRNEHAYAVGLFSFEVPRHVTPVHFPATVFRRFRPFFSPSHKNGENGEKRSKTALAPERRQGRQADIAVPAGDAKTGEKVADLARRADGWRCRFDPGQPHHALDDLLPAVVIGGEAPHLDRSALVDAGLRLGDAER